MNNSKIRLVIMDEDVTRHNRVAAALSPVPGIALQRICPDLSDGFNFVEHNPPNVALVSERLARRPEFEAVKTLFNCLRVRFATCSFRAQPALNGAHVNLGDTPRALGDALTGVLKNRLDKPNGASVGLLQPTKRMGEDRIVLIGSSTGGLDALLTVLGSYPAACPATVIVQHTGPSFSEGFARLLNSRVSPRVKLAEDQEQVEPGKVLIAPGSEKHLCLEGRAAVRCRFDPRDRISGHRPSIDALFSSATGFAQRVTGVILTGMGRDGASGLLKLAQAGAATIAQDEASSVVYGMPRIAAEMGAAKKVLPLRAIGTEILKSSMVVK